MSTQLPHMNKFVHVFLSSSVSTRFSSFKMCMALRQSKGGLHIFLFPFLFLAWFSDNNGYMMTAEQDNSENIKKRSSAMLIVMTGTVCNILHLTNHSLPATITQTDKLEMCQKVKLP